MTSQLLATGRREDLKPGTMEADVSELFIDFNKRFFWGKLKYVEVRWSPRMTLCAGLCVYHKRPGYCSIRLSRPLLSLRSKTDLVETLLHEMIHAYLFVTNNNRDRDGHGPEFLKHMYRINKEAELNISVFHTFGDEVRHYQQHVWECNGPCKLLPPYFGKVHRSMNRAPGPTDLWWEEHSLACGGIFSKVSEPKGFVPHKKKSVTAVAHEPKEQKNGDIRAFFKPSNYVTIKGSETSSEQTHKEITDVVGVDATNSSVSIDMNSERPEDDDGSFEYSASGENSNTILKSFGAVLGIPLRFLKRHAEGPDESLEEVQRPDLDKLPVSKRGKLKNLIRIPDQPTLDAFYKKKKASAAHSTVKLSIVKPLLSQSVGGSLKQQSVKLFFERPVKNCL